MDSNEKIPTWGQALIDNQKSLIGIVKGLENENTSLKAENASLKSEQKSNHNLKDNEVSQTMKDLIESRSKAVETNQFRK